MNSLKLILALALAFVFTGCEITVVDEYSSYADDYYETSYYSYVMDCDLQYTSGYVDVHDVRTYTCSSWEYIGSNYAYDFSPSYVVEHDGNALITYNVNYVDAFSYNGNIYITYDVGGGMVFEYNYTEDEVGVYKDGIVDYYSN